MNQSVTYRSVMWVSKTIGSVINILFEWAYGTDRVSFSFGRLGSSSERKGKIEFSCRKEINNHFKQYFLDHQYMVSGKPVQN